MKNNLKTRGWLRKDGLRAYDVQGRYEVLLAYAEEQEKWVGAFEVELREDTVEETARIRELACQNMPEEFLRLGTVENQSDFLLGFKFGHKQRTKEVLGIEGEAK